MQFEREATDRQLRQRAYQDEMERRHKAEEARRETEAILEAQAEEVGQHALLCGCFASVSERWHACDHAITHIIRDHTKIYPLFEKAAAQRKRKVFF